MLVNHPLAESIHAAGTVLSVSRTDADIVQLTVRVRTGRLYAVIPANQDDERALTRIGGHLVGRTLIFGGYLRTGHGPIDLVLAQTIGISWEPPS